MIIEEPHYINPCNFRDYEMYRDECNYVKGWNDAMRYAFGIKEEKNAKQYLKENGMSILEGMAKE